MTPSRAVSYTHLNGQHRLPAMDHHPGSRQDTGIHPRHLCRPDHTVLLNPAHSQGHLVHVGHEQYNGFALAYPGKYAARHILPDGYAANLLQLAAHLRRNPFLQSRGARSGGQAADTCK